MCLAQVLGHGHAVEAMVELMHLVAQTELLIQSMDHVEQMQEHIFLVKHLLQELSVQQEHQILLLLHSQLKELLLLGIVEEVMGE